MAKVDKLTKNDKSFATWQSNGGVGEFVAILDGDDVASGSDFIKVILDGNELAKQRGKKAKLTIYDSKQKTVIPL